MCATSTTYFLLRGPTQGTLFLEHSSVSQGKLVLCRGQNQFHPQQPPTVSWTWIDQDVVPAVECRAEHCHGVAFWTDLALQTSASCHSTYSSVKSKWDDLIVMVIHDVCCQNWSKPISWCAGSSPGVSGLLCHLPDIVLYLLHIVSLMTAFRFCFLVQVCAFFFGVSHMDSRCCCGNELRVKLKQL